MVRRFRYEYQVEALGYQPFVGRVDLRYADASLKVRLERDDLVDDRNKRKMNEIKIDVVKIGEQEWMTKNMAVTVDRYGKELILGEDYEYPIDGEESVKQYGLLYTWEAAMRIAPDGWHVPSDAEWTQLENYVGSQSKYRCGGDAKNIAKALASTSGWEISHDPFTVGNNPSSNNATGFNALPVDKWLPEPYASFWSATQYCGNRAFYRYLANSGSYVNRYAEYKFRKLSVRCLRD